MGERPVLGLSSPAFFKREQPGAQRPMGVYRAESVSFAALRLGDMDDDSKIFRQ